MEFSNLFFLYIFLPLTLAVYFLVPGLRWKNRVLIAASLIFYSFGKPAYLLLLLFTAMGNYVLGFYVSPKHRKSLWIAIAFNLVFLCFFKYTNFLLGTFGLHGSDGNGVLKLAQPLGISFYTFQMISYHVDIYRRTARPARSFSSLLLYIAMFPKMVMGPIVRYQEVAVQLRQRRLNSKAVFDGAVRFLVGLSKKVLIADYCGKVISELAGQKVGAALWLTALMFMFRIYFEFSGYSDMAIGLGKIFGFRYPENFDRPYMSSSITEFWRRWHMTLGSFFRDYVYIPLGGNRRGKVRQILNLLIVWALTGLWHGASWNYVLWGIYFFVLLSVEKQLLPKLEHLPYVLRLLGTMFFVLMGWVIFYHDGASLAQIGDSFARMFGKGKFMSDIVSVKLRNSLPLLLLCVLGSSCVPRMIANLWRSKFAVGLNAKTVSVKNVIYAVGIFCFAALLLYFCTASLVGTTSAPSIYASF